MVGTGILLLSTPLMRRIRPELPNGELIIAITRKLWLKILKFAVTERAWFIVTWQLLLPEQSPDHDEKVDPATGEGVKVTNVLFANEALQVEPQLIPAGELVTVPVPVPFRFTCRLNELPDPTVTALPLTRCSSRSIESETVPF